MFMFGFRGMSVPQEGAMESLENPEMNKVEDIMLSADRFTEILNETLGSYQFPKEVMETLYEFAQTVGGARNFKYGGHENTKIHDAVDAKDINAVDKLLKEGVYVDQWNEYKTPLFRAVFNHRNVEMAEFLIINGARRRIKSLVYELEKRENANELLDLLRPYVDEDPLLGAWTTRDLEARALDPAKFGFTLEPNAML